MHIGSITQVNESGTSREDMPVKIQLNQIIILLVNTRFFYKNNGTCVIDTFIGMYGQEPKVTKEKFIDMCQEYYNQYNFNRIVENGISPRCVDLICEQYDIAHYVFDISKIIFYSKYFKKLK